MGNEHFDTVVVGSGFGGAVSACRLAEAGKSVCVLERGRAYPPGSFPRAPHELGRSFWDPSEGLYGMFNAWSFRHFAALVSSGLGGGSLIYANVLLRKDEKWFMEERADGSREDWPVQRADLDAHYDRVERMLGARPYPFELGPYDGTPKTRAFRDAADRLGLEWSLPPLAVSFSDGDASPRPGAPMAGSEDNLHGSPRQTCRLCGECDVGCNYGSKNTLDFTYLTRAAAQGAEIRTLSEVRRFARRPSGGYSIDYVQHDSSREGRPYDTSSLPRRTVTADRLILGAGAFGSTFLLLRNRDRLPGLSPMLGRRFSGNGDYLTSAVLAARALEPTRGPVITSTVRVPDVVDGGTGPGFYLQEAGFPVFLAWMLQAADTPSGVGEIVALAKRYVRQLLGRHVDTDVSAEISAVLGRSRLATNSLPLLGMGRDEPDGTMRLHRGRLEVDWKIDASRPLFDRMSATMRSVAEAWSARFVENPLSLLGQLITVHPLGGCSMGRSREQGVVDAWGRVFGHPGLYVVDGAVLPGPVGPNPSLTIAALAERFAERIVEGDG